MPYYGIGYVVRFAVETTYLQRFSVQNVGDQMHDELWVPAEELPEFNSHIQGLIEITAEFRRP